MNFMQRLPLVLFAALGCQMGNPAFDDDAADDPSKQDSETRGNDEVVDGSGSSDGVDGVDTSSSSSSSSDGVDTSSSSDGVDTSSSSDGVDTSSSSEESSSSSEADSSTDANTTDGNLTDGGMEGPIFSCPVVEPAEACLPCMQNNCCVEIDLDCFNGVDPKCTCTLACLADGGINCAIGCGAGQLPAAHAEMIYTCGLEACGDFCGA